MIRSLTFVSALLAGVSGLYLYSEKHRTTLLDQQISRIVADTQQVRERTSMLRAEWALLNQPDRLQQLSGRFLPQLGAMAPTQFVQMASLDARLPAVGPETPPHPIVTPETAPSLVGAHPGQPAMPATTSAQPELNGAAIARADAPHQPGRPAGLALASAAEQQVARADAAADAGASRTDAAQTAATPGATSAATRLAQAHAKVAAHHDVQLADADTGSSDDAARPDVVPQAAMRRVVAHTAAHAAHAAAPVRMAYNSGAMATRPAVSAVSSSYPRPPVIAAAAWHSAHASWPSARPATYSAPYSAPAPMIGSSLGSSRSSLPAPVPVSDGN